MIRALIADDQDMVRIGFRMILDAQDDMEVVADVADGVEAVRRARELRPDVCLLDIRMPGLGLEVTRQLAGPDVADPIKVVVVTTFDLDEYVHTALRNGASGFLLKDAGPALLLEAVRAAVRGDALVSPQITVRLLQHFNGSAASRSSSNPTSRSPPARRMSPRRRRAG
jgi:DNA-binding NarL/FixJ family response regulator